jgi:hypothetical protein
MSDIQPIAFGSNLRPSTVTNIKKINEIIAVVNTQESDISDIKKSLQTLFVSAVDSTSAINNSTGNTTSIFYVTG